MPTSGYFLRWNRYLNFFTFACCSLEGGDGFVSKHFIYKLSTSIQGKANNIIKRVCRVNQKAIRQITRKLHPINTTQNNNNDGTNDNKIDILNMLHYFLYRNPLQKHSFSWSQPNEKWNYNWKQQWNIVFHFNRTLVIGNRKKNIFCAKNYGIGAIHV